MKAFVRFGLMCLMLSMPCLAQAQLPWDGTNAAGSRQWPTNASEGGLGSRSQPGATPSTPQLPATGFSGPAKTTGPMQPGRQIQATGGDVLLSPEQSPVDPSALLDQPTQSKPFGWELFAGGGAIARARRINPDYVVSPGDNIAVQVWGTEQTYNEILTVDLQGNIFIPSVGPVRVAGLTNAGLNNGVARALARVYTEQVRVYTNLLNTQPVGVYVTGAVYRPGRYAGEHTDSLLHYMAQAGGVDLRRGSFRDVTVLRQGQPIQRVDLYQFLLKGLLPQIDFRDNDTIVVGPQKSTVQASGDVRNAYQFEIENRVESGKVVLDMVLPLPKASHVAVRGVRSGQPYNAYVSIEEFQRSSVHDGDAMIFQSDMVQDTIFVSVTGQHSGPSSLAVPRGARLSQVLDMVPVDQVADVPSIYIRRKSVAERQRRALEMALDQLQRAVLTTRSVSQSDAEIRVREADLVQKFVDKARSVEPEGRVVLAGGERMLDMQLEPEDVIVIPPKSDVVIVSGEVNLPQTLLYREVVSAADYVAGSGGFTDRADTANLLVVRQNGTVLNGSNPTILPGDHIMVMPRADSKGFAIFKDIIEVMYRIAVSSGVVIRLL